MATIGLMRWVRKTKGYIQLPMEKGGEEGYERGRRGGGHKVQKERLCLVVTGIVGVALIALLRCVFLGGKFRMIMMTSMI